MQRAGRRGFYNQGTDLISKYNLDILTCMEMTNLSRALKIIKRIPMPNFLEIPPVGFLGGIWLFWKDKTEFKITILKTHE